MIQFLDRASTTIVARQYAGVTVTHIDAETTTLKNGETYHIGHLYEQNGPAPAGRYLVDNSGTIHYLIDPGIGGREAVDYTGRKVTKLDSPKSQIMALVVDGILTQKLSWSLILIGAFLAIAMELMGLPSLPIAVGVYLPISTSATMFMGGIVRWLVERKTKHLNITAEEAESGPGVLFSSGLIAGGAITGVVLAALSVAEWDTGFNLAGKLGGFDELSWPAFLIYIILLCVPLYLVGKRVARKT
jgi:hypothetical protein